jgi:hypothetical protein
MNPKRGAHDKEEAGGPPALRHKRPFASPPVIQSRENARNGFQSLDNPIRVPPAPLFNTKNAKPFRLPYQTIPV